MKKNATPKQKWFSDLGKFNFLKASVISENRKTKILPTCYKSGISLTEAIIVCLMTSILTLSAVEMISHAFGSQVAVSKNVKARQYKNNLSERISSKIKEGSKPYYSTLSLYIPIREYSYSVQPEVDSLAVLIPKFNTDGSIVQPSTNVTTFIGVAFSIVPQYMVDPNKDTNSYVMVETTVEFDLVSSASDPVVINQTLPTDWSGGESYVLAENLLPATFKNLGTEAFDVEGDQVNFAFVPASGNIYFPSYYGTKTIDDSQYLTRIQFRNFRI